MSDITITRDDRPAPPPRRTAARLPTLRAPKLPLGGRGEVRAAKRPAAIAAPAAPVKPGRRRVAPTWWRRTRPAAIALALALAVGLPLALAVHAGTAGRVGRDLAGHIDGLAAGAGLRLARITFEGNRHESPETLMATMAVHRGDPILGLDLSGMRERIAASPWVSQVTLERRLPAELHVTVAEREPVAIWQSEGRYFLIDSQGQTISSEIDGYRNLPLVVGEGAEARAAPLLAMLATEPALAARVRAAQWVGDRRWNIEFDQPSGGIEVRLPEDSPEAAWHQLAQLEHETQLLERKVVVIDMRLPDRYVLRQQPAPPASTPPAAKPRRKGSTEA